MVQYQISQLGNLYRERGIHDLHYREELEKFFSNLLELDSTQVIVGAVKDLLIKEKVRFMPEGLEAWQELDRKYQKQILA